jgi:hypothetical protein
MIAFYVLLCCVTQVVGLWLIAKGLTHENETPYDIPVRYTMDTISTDYEGLI